METVDNRFGSRLAAQRRWWQAGLLLRALTRIAGWALVALLLYGLLDFFLALVPVNLIVMGGLLSLFLGGLGLVWMIRVLCLDDRRMAQRADALLGSRRRTVFSAFELEAWIRRAVGEGLPAYLVARSVDRACDELGRLRFRQYFPTGEVLRQAAILGLQALLVAVPVLANPQAAGIVWQRIRFPLRDIPPYSTYRFQVSPPSPEVPYGGDLDVSVAVSGGPVRSPVWFVTRHNRQAHQVACFQEGNTRFAQRLEKVVESVEFCFVMGRARSPWHRVRLLMQPRIAGAALAVTSPPYSRLPRREFLVGSEDLAGLPGSRVELTVTSNRRLLDGTLVLRPKDRLAGEQSVSGVKTGPNTVAFQWTLKAPAELGVVIRDVQGTRNREPFVLQQRIVPDRPPRAAIAEPPGFALATPRATLPFVAQAEDDLGLRRVDLVRTVVGYRDRTRPMGATEGERRFELRDKIELEKLGVEAGQSLEFYLEASDLNPSLAGHSASEIVRVQIISEEEYAAMLRARTTLEDFVPRFQAAAREIARLRQTLRALRDAAASPSSSLPEKANKISEAEKACRAAAALLDRLAADFPAYALEKSLSDKARDMADRCRSWAGRLAAASAGDSGLLEMAREMLAGLGEEQGGIEKVARDAAEVAALARLGECAAQFRQLVRLQSELVRQLSRYAQAGSPPDAKLLGPFGQRQEEIRQSLLTLKKELAERAQALPEGYPKLKASALAFAECIGEQDMKGMEEFSEALKNYEIPGLMAKGVNAAGNQDGRGAHRYASLALERMERLMTDRSGSSFGGLCQGEGRDFLFEVPKDLQSTLMQLLSSLMGAGSGAGEGTVGTAGAGLAGGDANDGYWMGGHSFLNLPVFGPGRQVFGSRDLGATGTGPGATGRAGTAARVSTAENLPVTDKAKVAGQSLPAEAIPEKYREAVKRYFSE